MAYVYGMRLDRDSNATTEIDEANRTARTTGYVNGEYVEFSGGGGGSAELASLIDGSLTSIDIPSGVTSIRDSAFSTSLPSLATINVPSGVTQVGAQFGYRLVNLENVDLPASVTSIGDYFLGGTSGDTSLMKRLTLYCRATTPPTLGSSPFFNRNYDKITIYVPGESVQTYRSANGWGTMASSIRAIE